MTSTTVEVWTAAWYPGDVLLRKKVEELWQDPAAKAKAKFKIVDVDARSSDAEGLRITTVPVVRVLESGKEVRREAGAVGADVLRDLIGLKPVEKNGKHRKKRAGKTATK